jgi:ferredoxin
MSRQLRVNAIACTAHGMCAEILPERVTLDDWGYPLLSGQPIGTELEAHARRAVDACPVFALRLEQSQEPDGPGAGGRRRLGGAPRPGPRLRSRAGAAPMPR